MAGNGGFIQPPNAPSIFVPGQGLAFTAANDNGLVGGFVTSSTGVRTAVLYVNGTIENLGFSGESGVSGINNLGQVVGWYTTPGFSGAHGFIWQNGSFVTLDAPYALGYQSLNGINDNGVIVADDYVYINGKFVYLGFGGWQVQLSGINDDGIMVGHHGFEGVIVSPATIHEVSTGPLLLAGILVLYGVSCGRTRLCARSLS